MKYLIDNFKFLKLIFFIILAFSFFYYGDVLAVTISPARQTVVVEPSSSQMVKVRLVNNEDEVITFVSEVDAFSIDSETGRAVFGKEDEAKNWISASPKQIKLAPNEQGEFIFTISAPAGAESISHYLGLFVKEVAEEGQVAVSSRTGSLLFLHMSGSVQEDLSRVFFTADKKIYFDLPVELSMQLRNNGNIHLIPQGEIIITDMWGKELSKIMVNGKQRKVLPQEQWRENYELGVSDLQGGFGLLKATMIVNYGLTDKQMTDSVEFWYVPKILIFWAGGILAGIILLVFGLVFLKKRFRKL